MPAHEACLQQQQPFLGSRPMRVLSTGYHGVHTFDPAHTPTLEQQQCQEGVAHAQAKWLELSSNAKHASGWASDERAIMRPSW